VNIADLQEDATAEEEFYDGIDSFEEEIYQTTIVRKDSRPAYGTSPLVGSPPPVPDSQDDTFISAHDEPTPDAQHEPTTATSAHSLERAVATAAVAAPSRVPAATPASAAQAPAPVYPVPPPAPTAAPSGVPAATPASASQAPAPVPTRVPARRSVGNASGEGASGSGAPHLSGQPGAAQLGGTLPPTPPGGALTSAGSSPPVSPGAIPKNLRAPGGGHSSKRQKGAAFMTEVTGNQSAHRPIKTAQEIALYDRLVSSYGETEHEKIAAAFTAEANAVAHDASQQLWPKFARHIKQYEREQKQLHLTKGAIAGDAAQAAEFNSMARQFMQPTLGSFRPPPPPPGLVGSAPTLPMPYHQQMMPHHQLQGVPPPQPSGFNLMGAQQVFNMLTQVPVQQNPFRGGVPFYSGPPQPLMQPPQHNAAPAAMPKAKQAPRKCHGCGAPQKGHCERHAGNKWYCPIVGYLHEFEAARAAEAKEAKERGVGAVAE